MKVPSENTRQVLENLTGKTLEELGYDENKIKTMAAEMLEVVARHFSEKDKATPANRATITSAIVLLYSGWINATTSTVTEALDKLRYFQELTERMIKSGVGR